MNDELSTNKTTLNEKSKNKMMEIKDMPKKSTLANMKASKPKCLNEKHKPKCIISNQKNQNVTRRNTYEG